MELQINVDQYLSKFTVRPNQTLFPLSAKEKKDLLIKKRCIVCGNKLRIDLKGNGRCVSKKNNCKFFIRAKVLAKYICTKKI
jgi:hypothetical protein